MDFGNNGPEFNWNYMGGAMGQGAPITHGGHSLPIFPQMGHINSISGNSGHGSAAPRQWLHSNQANTYQQSMAHNSAPQLAYEPYNYPVMHSNASIPKPGGDERGHMGMGQMGGNFAGYAGGMQRNGLNGGMGHGGNNGHSNW